MTPLTLALLLIVATPAATASSAARSQRAAAYLHFLLGETAYARQDFGEAIDELSKAFALDPTDATVALELADAHARLRRFREAADWAQKARGLAPEAPEPMSVLARLYEILGRREEARDLLAKLIGVEPAEMGHRLRLAEALKLDGKDAASRAVLEEAMTEEPSNGDVAMMLAESYAAAGRLDQAIAVLEKGLAANPAELALRSKLADSYLAIKDRDKARRTLLSIAQQEGVSVAELARVAEVLRGDAIGDDGGAAVVYARAADLAPLDPGLRFNLATSLLRAGALRRARGEYERVLALLEPVDAQARLDVLRRLAGIELSLGDKQAAVDSLRQAETLAPAEDWGVSLALARSLESTGDLKGALEATGHSLELRPLSDEQNAPLWIARAAYLALNRDREGALKIYEQLVSQHSLDLKGRAFLVQAFLRAGDTAEAASLETAVAWEAPAERRAFSLSVAQSLAEAGATELSDRVMNQAIAREPEELGLYLGLARLHQRRDDFAGARQILERAERLGQDSAEYHFELGAVSERLGRKPEAEQELSHAIELNPRHAMALNYLGYVFVERGVELERAVGLIQRAVELDPDNGAFLDSLGWANYKLGRLDLAAQQLEEAILHIDDDAVVYDHLGDVYVKMGRGKEALDTYRRALVLDGASKVHGLVEKVEALSSQLAKPASGQTPQNADPVSGAKP